MLQQQPFAVMTFMTRVLARAGAVLWAVVNELLIQPREYTAFNLSLDKLRDDPRIMVTLGTPVSGYGQESHNRAARQRIPHRVYNDNEGREHVQVILLMPACLPCIS
jgi:import inner membrane translocase subunit TIM21